ncbi:hypothetical protein BJY59DRAFT_690066 [Rhodotorula toruloides]
MCHPCAGAMLIFSVSFPVVCEEGQDRSRWKISVHVARRTSLLYATPVGVLRESRSDTRTYILEVLLCAATTSGNAASRRRRLERAQPTTVRAPGQARVSFTEDFNSPER